MVNLIQTRSPFKMTLSLPEKVSGNIHSRNP
jgi:hypothetical protein